HHLPGVMHFLELVIGIVVLSAGQSLWASFAGAAPDISAPSVPANLLVTGSSATAIDISWNASTDDVGVTGYHVYRNTSLIASPATPSYTDSGLTPNTNYTYTVSAFDAVDNTSSQSAPLPTSTLADTSAPSTPTNVRQTGSTISSISIAWNASSDNVSVAGYEIYRNGSLVRTQAGTTYTDTGLAVYSTYTYTISAYDGTNNFSGLSTPFYAGSAQDVTPPSVPDNVHKASSTVSSITLAWNNSTDDAGVTGYRVYRNGSLIASPAGASYTDTGLTVSSSYTYTVSAYDNATNASAESAPYTTASSDDTTAPSVPNNVHTTSVLDTSISLAWNTSTDDVAVTGYKIYRNSSLVGTTSSTAFTDTGLLPVTDYAYTVHSYDAANNTSAASTSLDTQTAYDTTNPSVPANLVASARTDTSITLGWDLSTDNVAVTGYDVYRGATLIATTASTGYTDSGLGVDTAYTYKVRAHDASGNNSAQSTQLSTRTLTDEIAPASPTNLSSSDQTTTTIDLDWTAATDDVAVTGYKIYRDGVFIALRSVTNYQDTGLHYNRQYAYTVTAVDAGDNESAVSAALNISTLPDTVAPNVTLSAPPDGQTNVQYTIPISATASDDLDLARVEFYADSTLITTITTAPFALNWDTYNKPNGSHLITAKAIDGSGNTTSSSATISINNPPPPLKGDLNGDHKVTILDLSMFLSRWQKPGSGDFNGNGKVDIFDLSVILSQYGKDNNY
ncbi:MAG: Ricin-type beta-trefoil lectin domain-like, partial [Candidatus Saccharibacteria bacterium]|nr:Ricin-type beta-trefoil lectin domain-like [Candidatus Saccharibacteria bacterium]